MKKTLFLGTTPDHNEKAFVTVELENGRLSLSGVIGPKWNGDCTGSCGQCHDELKNIVPAEPWNAASILKLLDVWKRFHLNDMHAECLHQRGLGWTWGDHPSEPCPTCGYRLGSAWLFEELPAEVVKYIEALPETSVVYPWKY